LNLERKDSAGTRLINLFCSPYRGRRVFGHERPEEWARFQAYCIQDVVALQDVRRKLKGWPSTFERDLWYVDQRINDRGLRVDLDMARAAVKAAQANAEEAEHELIELTGVKNPNSIQQLMKWLIDNDCPLADLKAETVAIALEAPFPKTIIRVLELRQELALVASNKYIAALRSVSTDGRLRGQFKFHGAHTGRWSSSGVQLHNLPRQSDPREAEAILDLALGLGAPPEMLKSLVRPMFLGPFTISDLAGIEARILAWLAGQQWVLDAVAAGRDIYEETAKRMGGMTRQQGKVAVLALGYQGAVGSMRNMGYGGRADPKSDAQIRIIVDRWREANPKIVQFWYNLERAFRSGGKAGRIIVEAQDKERRILLPSGRKLYYHNVTAGQRLTYRHIRGYQEETYGGRLTENVTQAVARDVLADAMIRLDREGYPIVAHIHDEAVVESDAVEEIRAIMKTGPAWAAGLPLDASADYVQRYTKG
jgi:DNA polymerase